MKDGTEKLEELIAQYEAAIFGGGDTDKLNELSCAVETEADRIGYANHARLMALHTMAERAAEENDA